MDILKVLNNAIEDKFKAESVLYKSLNIIKEMAEEKTMQKYKTVKLTRDGMEFELIAVKAKIYEKNIGVSDVEIHLQYVVCSKLPKAKRNIVEEVKKELKANGWLRWNNFKIALWHTLEYHVEIEEVISGEINLKIE